MTAAKMVEMCNVKNYYGFHDWKTVKEDFVKCYYCSKIGYIYQDSILEVKEP